MYQYIYTKGINDWWIIGFLLLVFFVWITLKKLDKHKPTNQREKTAINRLKKNYIRGKITKSEYEEEKIQALQNKNVMKWNKLRKLIGVSTIVAFIIVL